MIVAPTSGRNSKRKAAAVVFKHADLPSEVEVNFSKQFAPKMMALFGVSKDSNNPFVIVDEPAMQRRAFNNSYPTTVAKNYSSGIKQGTAIFYLVRFTTHLPRTSTCPLHVLNFLSPDA